MENELPRVDALLDLTRTIASPLFVSLAAPWRALPMLGAFIATLGATLSADDFEEIAPQVWVARDARVAASALLIGPCVVDHEAEIRHCAFVRGNALVGKRSVVGNSTELKNALLFDDTQAPHFNYVGDSILGWKTHMGAGSITSNVRSDRQKVVVHTSGGPIETGMKKLGAILGDFVEIGCNAVLNPGVVVGRGSIVYPAASVRGIVPARSIYKRDGVIALQRAPFGEV
ncbi:MAG: UDP-N-acetylglucosamine pyrophosphorylase [Oscillospiraceae bacterium]|jgi:NDP-sugar pyrophosphorylase family protein|nr:UDP-N-acetylglucosamine pyrophosphorylase [Oscillospiraceae bacterium]